MNVKVKRVLQGILFVLIIIAFIWIGNIDFSSKTVVDNERFDLEYSNVSKDNVFTYATGAEVYSKLKNGNAIIFMGFPSNKWSGPYANMLNNAAKETGIKEILYYDFKEDRDSKNATYQSIVLKLSGYVPTLDDGRQNIYAPTLIIIKDGNVLAYDDETAILDGNITPDVYWDQYHEKVKTEEFVSLFLEFLE